MICRTIVAVCLGLGMAQSAAAESVTLRYGQIPSTVRSISGLYLFIAQQKGFFAREDIRLELVPIAGGTPRPIVDRLHYEIGEILKLPDIREKLATVANIPTPSTPEQMQDHIERDAARWSRVVDIKGIERY